MLNRELHIIFYELLLKLVCQHMPQCAGLLSCDSPARRFVVGGSPGSGFPNGVRFSSLICASKQAAAHASLLGWVAVARQCVQGHHPWFFHRVNAAIAASRQSCCREKGSS